jgi:hypothetical protein
LGVQYNKHHALYLVVCKMQNVLDSKQLLKYSVTYLVFKLHHLLEFNYHKYRYLESSYHK